jgi:hypothetical protein
VLALRLPAGRRERRTSRISYDAEVAARLWSVSETLCGSVPTNLFREEYAQAPTTPTHRTLTRRAATGVPDGKYASQNNPQM